MNVIVRSHSTVSQRVSFVNVLTRYARSMVTEGRVDPVAIASAYEA